MIHSLFAFYSFVFGLLIGSFLNVIILRLPKNENFVQKRSRCPQCLTQLRWYHNIPLFSFLFLKGKCAFCLKPISWRYPLIELLTGLISFWLFPEFLDGISLGIYLFFFSIACIFICHFFIDLDHHLLLDKLNIYLIILIFPYVAFTYSWKYWLIGGALGFGAPLAVTWLFYKLRGQIGLGGGDIKLYGILGLLLGPTGIIFTIFLSCMVGAIVGIGFIMAKKMTKDNPIAFGPSILLVAAFQIYFPDLAHAVQSWLF